MPRIAAWVPQILGSVVGPTLPKCPRSKVIAPTIVTAITNIAADVKTGRERTESHTTSGNNSSTGTTISHHICGNRKMMTPVVAAIATTPTMPSTSCRRGVGTRIAGTSHITNGATVMMPIASDANQCRQVITAGTSEL